MSRYASRRELQTVIKDTLKQRGIDPATVVMSRVFADMKIIGDSYYGWTCSLDIDPCDVAKKHLR
jgi:hypothetical protein